jgi:prepilin-type N-terminal cleavage/methylation domain-containing protein
MYSIPRSISRSAFTLMELMISISILSMLMLLVAQSLEMSTKLNDRVTRQTDINNQANDVVNKLSLQLRQANAATITIPGTFPLQFTPSASGSSNVVAYSYSVTNGLTSTFTAMYETYPRRIIYDGSTTPGRIILQLRNQTTGAWLDEQVLSSDVAENGFSMTRIGNTLQLRLTLRSQTRDSQDIIYTAQAQTIFLRSTVFESSGSSPVTYVDNPIDADGVTAGTTTSAPSIIFGNQVVRTSSTSTQKQISLFVTAPIGQVVTPEYIRVTLGNVDNTVTQVVAEGATVTVGSATITRQTYPPASEWPSYNGTYSVTLTGAIEETVTITATAVNANGVSVTEAQRFNKIN